MIFKGICPQLNTHQLFDIFHRLRAVTQLWSVLAEIL